MSEYAWKINEDSTSGKPFYSSIDWKIVAHNDFEFEGYHVKCDCKKT